MHQNAFGGRAPSGPAGELTALPRPHNGAGRGGRGGGKKGEEKGGKRREEGGRRRKGPKGEE